MQNLPPTRSARADARVDAVIVAYNSAATLRGCVAPLLDAPGVHAIVVDNASPDDSLAALDGLPVTAVRAHANHGFAAGCNLGTAHGVAPYVLLLNPDARLEPGDLAALVSVLDREPGTGIVGPRILEGDGELAHSQRRFPRRASTFAQALFLHRLWPLAEWSDELIRDSAAYERPGAPDWLSGACLLVRRTALEAVGGLDEGFFLYCEDIDLCARVRGVGWDVRYEPAATARHEGGVSGPREALLGVYARNRVRYARKHDGRAAATLEAAGVALGHATHALASLTRPAHRRGHVAALRALARASSTTSGAA
jgi:N-acetylglucosaminyl-diphospho-decaprenol L-rhamnosyltransferase